MDQTVTTYGELPFEEQGLVDQSIIPEGQNLDIYSVRLEGILFPHCIFSGQ